jgi:hypothetical protein
LQVPKLESHEPEAQSLLNPHGLPDAPPPELEPPEELPEPEFVDDEVGDSALQAAPAAATHDVLSSHDAQWNVCVPTV